MALLQAVVDRERSGRAGFSASRLAEHTAIERSRTSRLTQELTDLGFLEKGEGAAFRVGPAYFELARARHAPWLRAARPELRRIAAERGAVTRISTLDGARAVLLRYESAPGAPSAATTAGMVTPVWCTGAGRALLWADDRESLESRLEGIEFVGVGGPNAAQSCDEVQARMDRDRAAGYVRAVEEFEYGITETAVPILVPGPRGHSIVIGALSAATRSNDERALHGLGAELLASAQQLAALAS